MESTTDAVSIEHEVAIAASPETVWGFLVDPDKAVRWMGICRSWKRISDLKTSPTLPGVTVSTKPERKVRKLSPLGTPRMSRTER